MDLSRTALIIKISLSCERALSSITKQFDGAQKRQ